MLTLTSCRSSSVRDFLGAELSSSRRALRLRVSPDIRWSSLSVWSLVGYSASAGVDFLLVVFWRMRLFWKMFPGIGVELKGTPVILGVNMLPVKPSCMIVRYRLEVSDSGTTYSGIEAVA